MMLAYMSVTHAVLIYTSDPSTPCILSPIRGGRPIKPWKSLKHMQVEYTFFQVAFKMTETRYNGPVFFFFFLGNGLLISAGRQYDRVYCGARCPLSELAYLKQLLKVCRPRLGTSQWSPP